MIKSCRQSKQPALCKNDLRLAQLAYDLFRLVMPRHHVPPPGQNLKRIPDHSEGGRSGGKRRVAKARVRKLRTWLGRQARDVTRKIAGNAEAKAAFAETLGLINRLLRQKD